MLTRCFAWIILLAGFSSESWAQDKVLAIPSKVGQELEAYVAKQDDAFAWKLLGERKVSETHVYHLSLTSQHWQGIVWQHDLLVYEPQTLSHPNHLLLVISGGSNGKAPKEKEMAIGTQLASLTGARVAVIHQVPNQPLLDGRHEDDLITETWLRYLDTGDTQWPLLFPMVKSAVKAMDALEAFAVSRQWPVIEGFVTTGASKRGWTSWLTPAADSRVIATAPMVIDMLNFPAQIKHQFKMWGEPSEQIHDYTSKGLIPKDGVPRPGREAKLWEMMDPYSYRDRVTIPKLLMVGANDPYWTTDAMNQYWDDLSGAKSIFRAANAGHGFEGSTDKAISAAAAFFTCVTQGRSLPALDWHCDTSEDILRFHVRCNERPESAKLWCARSATLDFRKSIWESTPMTKNEDAWQNTTTKHPDGHVAIYAELSFLEGDIPYSLSTLVHCR
jgi:PhoPQ-activated pathogenicity-related protein